MLFGVKGLGCWLPAGCFAVAGGCDDDDNDGCGLGGEGPWVEFTNENSAVVVLDVLRATRWWMVDLARF
jgi:hypothetical protein